MHSDFILFNEIRSQVKPSIVDSHGHCLEDTLAKLQALAGFAATYGRRFHRIETFSKVGNKRQILDCQNPEVGQAVLATTKTPTELSESGLTVDYV